MLKPRENSIENRMLLEQFAVRRRRKRAITQLYETAQLAAAVVGLPGGCLLLGVLLVWVVNGGPDGASIAPRVLWTRGLGLGFALLGALGFGYIWGASRNAGDGGSR